MGSFRRSELILISLVALVTAATALLVYGPGPSTLSFVFATVALAGVAWIVSFATEQLGESFGPEVTGLMQSTLGNLPEFFVVVFALSAGQIVVAQASIIGSVLGNALLILGVAIIAGARQSADGIMRFSPRLPNDTSMLLLLAVFIIVLLGISIQVGDKAADNALQISIIGAVCLLVVYAGWVWDYCAAAQKATRRTARPRAYRPRLRE